MMRLHLMVGKAVRCLLLLLFILYSNSELLLQADTFSQNTGQPKVEVSDLRITQKIRQKVTTNKHLTKEAKSIEIITDHGVVTLKGPVRSEKEKTVVDQIARDVAGPSYVQNELEVMRQG